MRYELLLQWHYLIFLLPFGVAALLLLLSSLRPGHRSGGSARAHGHPAHAPAAQGHSSGHAPTAAAGGHGARFGLHRHVAPSHSHAAPKARGKAAPPAQKGAGHSRAHSPFGSLLEFLGIGRAPLMLVGEAFCVAWGFAGFWANRFLAPMPAPTLAQVGPSLLIAGFGGWAGARLAAEIFTRVMPAEESRDVSRSELFGLTGQVTFPVSETTGRIHIYDENGTLHDESCRLASGHLPIPKGCRALVMDMDAQGRLVVEAIPGL